MTSSRERAPTCGLDGPRFRQPARLRDQFDLRTTNHASWQSDLSASTGATGQRTRARFATDIGGRRRTTASSPLTRHSRRVGLKTPRGFARATMRCSTVTRHRHHNPTDQTFLNTGSFRASGITEEKLHEIQNQPAVPGREIIICPPNRGSERH